MEKQAVPYESWPWWVKFFIIPSGSRIWGNTGQFWIPFLYWLGGTVIIFLTDWKVSNPDSRFFNMSLFVFNLGMFMTFQSYAVNWILKHSDPRELKEEGTAKKLLIGVLQAVLLIILPLFYTYFNSKGN